MGREIRYVCMYVCMYVGMYVLCPITISDKKVKVIPQQAGVAQGVPGRLRLRNFLDVSALQLW